MRVSDMKVTIYLNMSQIIIKSGKKQAASLNKLGVHFSK